MFLFKDITGLHPVKLLFTGFTPYPSQIQRWRETRIRCQAIDKVMKMTTNGFGRLLPGDDTVIL